MPTPTTPQTPRTDTTPYPEKPCAEGATAADFAYWADMSEAFNRGEDLHAKIARDLLAAEPDAVEPF